jgi:outer membrane immunogenic protein
MRRLAFLGSVLVATTLGLPALAADIPVKAVRPAPPIIIDHWTGFYVGVNGGYSWGSARTDLTATTTSVGTITQTTLGGTVLAVTTIQGPTTIATASGRANVNGWLGGGQAGYNWKSNNWLFGIEADLQGTGERGGSQFCLTAGCPAGSTFAQADFRLRWFGTLRGRAGWLVNDSLLLYATGGLAVGRLNADYSLGTVGVAAPIATASTGVTRAGFVVGAGGEYRFSERWSAKLEYLYMDLGSIGATFGGSVTSVPLIFTVGDFRFVGVSTSTSTAVFNTRFTDHILRAGVNYRF